MKRVASYTIMEMIIVMLLSSLVFTIAFKSFEIISKHYISYKRSVDEIGDYSLLDRLISSNSLQCIRIEKTQDGVAFVFEKGRIDYDFSQDYILRTQAGAKDTFILEAASYKLLYLGKEVMEDANIVDEVFVEGSIKGEVRRFNYFKQYAANELMLEESKNILSE